MIYKSYKVYIKSPCCRKEVEVASFDYFYNAIDRRNELIKTFGRTNVRVEKNLKEVK